MSTPVIALCRRCRSEILPAEPRAPLVADMHRAPAKGMTSKPDPRAERIARRKAAKLALRAVVTNQPNASEAVTLVLRTIASPPVDDDCAECRALQRRAS